MTDKKFVSQKTETNIFELTNYTHPILYKIVLKPYFEILYHIS